MAAYSAQHTHSVSPVGEVALLKLTVVMIYCKKVHSQKLIFSSFLEAQEKISLDEKSSLPKLPGANL